MAYSSKYAQDFHHPLFLRHAPEWQTVEDCVAGERAIKHRKTAYLPHPEGEFPSSIGCENTPEGRGKYQRAINRHQARYSAYVLRAAFLNATGRTLQGLLGIAFTKPVKIKFSGDFAVMEKDADGKGTPITQMLREATSENLQKGRGGLFFDYTSRGEQTKITQGRGLLTMFNAKEIINWREVGDITTLVVLKYEEAEEDETGFGYTPITYWLELRMIAGIAYWRKWWVDANGGKGAGNTDLISFTDRSGKALDRLPWAWIGSESNQSKPQVPPLADIANLNIKHYQSEADIAEISHQTGNPTLIIKGLNQAWAQKFLDNGVRIGSTEGILLPQEGDAKLLQAEDRNLPLAVADRREKQMAMLGAKLLERGTAAKTATQAQNEAQTDNSVLSLCVGNVEAAFNSIFELGARFIAGSATVELNKRYEVANLDSQTLAVVMQMVQAGQMSLEDSIKYQQEIGLIDSTKPAAVLAQALIDATALQAGNTTDPDDPDLNNPPAKEPPAPTAE